MVYTLRGCLEAQLLHFELCVFGLGSERILLKINYTKIKWRMNNTKINPTFLNEIILHVRSDSVSFTKDKYICQLFYEIYSARIFPTLLQS